MDGREVKLTVTRWKESDEEEELRLGLIEQWFLVRGVPRTYRNWPGRVVLYQAASAFWSVGWRGRGEFGSWGIDG